MHKAELYHKCKLVKHLAPSPLRTVSFYSSHYLLTLRNFSRLWFSTSDSTLLFIDSWTARRERVRAYMILNPLSFENAWGYLNIHRQMWLRARPTSCLVAFGKRTALWNKKSFSLTVGIYLQLRIWISLVMVISSYCVRLVCRFLDNFPSLINL